PWEGRVLPSPIMLTPPHIDSVEIAVRADPLDPHDLPVKIDRHNQAIPIPPDVEHNPLRGDHARGSVGALKLCGIRPARLLDFGKPSVEGGFDRLLIAMPGKRTHELPQGAARDNPHRR